jgi:hypothetical protein
VFDGHFEPGNDNYRAYRFPWVGTPASPPKVAATGSGGKLTVKASWNGATQVATWQVLAGASAAGMSVVGSVPRSGFETTIPVTTSASLVAVRALDAAGHVLATSAPKAAASS